MFKKFIYKLVERGDHGSKVNVLFDYFIIVLILLSVVSITLESINSISINFKNELRLLDAFIVAIFTIEYLMRLYVSDLSHPARKKVQSLLKFIFSAYGIIDLISILPFYLPLVFKIDLRFLRLLRLVRFARILKINRYNNAFSLIWLVVKEKRTELTITGILAFLILTIASFFMYYVEGDIQPDKFPNVIAAFWWAIATLTTVGYGDVFPVTWLGKLISGIIALLGIGIVALPSGIISAGFIAKLEEKKKKNSAHCPHCGKSLE